MVSGLSKRVRSLAISNDMAHRMLEPMAATAAIETASKPGLSTTRAPASPSATALARTPPILSRKYSPAPIVMKIGVVKLSTPASASGMLARA